MEAFKFHVEPDVIRVDTSEEMKNTHDIINLNTFPIIFRIKVTRPQNFRVNPTSGIINAKCSQSLTIQRLRCTPKSDRFDIEALPYNEQMLILENMNAAAIPLQRRVQWLFNFGYIPATYSIRYKRTEPWDTIFPALNDPQILKISPKLSNFCEKTGITKGLKEHLSLNEFVILDAAIEEASTADKKN